MTNNEIKARRDGYLPKAEFLEANAMPEETFGLLAHFTVGRLGCRDVDGEGFWGWELWGDDDEYAWNKETVDACGRRFAAWRTANVGWEGLHAVQREYESIIDSLRAVWPSVRPD